MTLLKTYWPRMLWAMLVSLGLFAAAHLGQQYWPGTLLAVSLYKAHLLALGGWAGYWLDRALFPYGRPHEPLAAIDDALVHGGPASAEGFTQGFAVLPQFACAANDMMLRRAIVVAACLLTVALAA